MRDRGTHETVDHLLQPRPCLKLTGNSGYVDIDESEDIKPPWTAEFWIYRTTAADASVNLIRKTLKARADDDASRKAAATSQVEMLKGEEMLANAAQKAAKDRDAKSVREKDAVTEELIALAENNEKCLRDTAFKRVEYSMLVKAATKTIRELESNQYDELVNDLGPEFVVEEAAVETVAATAVSVAVEEEGEGVSEAAPFDEPSRLETETNVPVLEEEEEEATAATAAEAEAEAEAVAVFAAPPSAPSSRPTSPALFATPSSPPATATATGSRPGTRAKTPVDKMAPHPPIDWHGNGQSLVDHVFALAAAVRSSEQAEEDAITAETAADAAKKKARESELKKSGKGKGKGKGKGGSKADRKEKRKNHRETVRKRKQGRVSGSRGQGRGEGRGEGKGGETGEERGRERESLRNPTKSN